MWDHCLLRTICGAGMDTDHRMKLVWSKKCWCHTQLRSEWRNQLLFCLSTKTGESKYHARWVRGSN